MKIVLQSVGESEIRNSQAGDWSLGLRGVITALSRVMCDERSEIAVAVHEAIEAWLCREAGISDAEVTRFDALFEKEREEGKHGPFEEAGDDPRAIYYEQHQKATAAEKAICESLSLTWTEHAFNVNKLFKQDA